MLSLVVFALYVSEIFISRGIIKEQRILVDQRELADAGPYYKDAWQKLAVQAWKGGAQDPTMIDLLKSEGIAIHEGAPPGSAPASTNAAPQSPASAPTTPSSAKP